MQIHLALTAYVNYKELAVDQAKGSAGWLIARIHLGGLPPLLLPLLRLLPLPRRPHLPLTAPAQMRVAQIYPAVLELETVLEGNLALDFAQRDFDMVGCWWEGSPNNGDCWGNGVCPICAATGEICCGNCVTKGNQANHGCF